MASTESEKPLATFAFDPVPVRPRHDGWTSDKQVAFIEALAECGCVLDACRRVGMSSEGAYTLRRRIDAVSFRDAWDKALDHAICRVSDGAFSRSIHGVAVPHFYKGEQVGEHRRYDERLTMFLLRYRDPLRYAKTLDEFIYQGHPGQFALKLGRALDQLLDDATAAELGLPPGAFASKRRWPNRDDEDDDGEPLDDVGEPPPAP